MPTTRSKKRPAETIEDNGGDRVSPKKPKTTPRPRTKAKTVEESGGSQVTQVKSKTTPRPRTKARTPSTEVASAECRTKHRQSSAVPAAPVQNGIVGPPVRRYIPRSLAKGHKVLQTMIDFADDPSHSTLTSDERAIASLLPGFRFGLADMVFSAGYWSVAQEAQLLSTHTHGIRAILSSTPSSPSELRLWSLLSTRYSSTLSDLFRYGLRPSPPPSHTPAHSTYCDALSLLLTHPLFLNRISLLRDLLLRTISFRYAVPHAKPLSAPYSHTMPAFLRTAAAWAGDFDAVREAASCSSFWVDGGRSDDLFDVTELLEEEVPRTRVAATAGERVFFYLTLDDMELVRDALARVCDDHELPAVYYQEFRAEYEAAGGYGHDEAWVRERKEQWLVGGIREGFIRGEMAARGEGDVLLDVRGCDPDPLYHFDGSKTVEQLASIDGMMGGEHASVTWCLPRVERGEV